MPKLLPGLVVALPVGLGAVASCSAPKSAGAQPCSYVVAVDGSDDNDGMSAATPFATLEKARSAARRTSASAVCLRAGTYRRTAPLELTSEDDDETWRYYPADGINSAVLDGGGTTDIVSVVGGSRITFDGLKMQNFHAFGIHTKGGRHFGVPETSGNTVRNCDIGFNAITDWNSGAFFSEGASPNTILEHNYVHDLGSQGLAINTYFSPDESINGSVIASNVVLRTVQRKSDGGAIYVSMHGGSQDSHVTIRNNFVRDYGAPGVSGAAGIYIDDNASNVTVTENVVGPPTKGSVGPGHFGATLFEVHSGNRNVVTGNIGDLGDSARVITVLWHHGGQPVDFGMAGNTFTNNIILSSYKGRQRTNFGRVTENAFYQNLEPASNYKIADNIYFNEAGGTVNADGTITGDAHPIFQDPQIIGWTYTIASSSPAFRAPVTFPRIAGDWGPPGFAIPKPDTLSSAH